MSRIRMVSLLTALALGAAVLEAQGTTKPAKTTTPAQDSAKKLKRNEKVAKVDMKKAKASGDTAKAHALKKEIKKDKKARKAIQGKDTTSKKAKSTTAPTGAPPAKKP